MWLRKLDRERRAKMALARRTWLGVALATAVAAAGAGCAADYVTGSTAPVNLYIASINGGSVLDADIRNGSALAFDDDPLTNPFICENEVEVAVAVRNKNPNAPAPAVPSAVLLKSYQVQYFRTDGRGVEGVDVPYRITGNLSFAVDVATSGTSTVNIEVVRRQAKLEPPLTTINQAAILTAMAEITLYGETVSGAPVSASARFQIDFADFGDDDTSCPS
jgi:hypothetical protein